MSKKNKSLASQALLEMNDIRSAIRKESNNTLKGLLSEAVKDALRESAMEDDEDDDYEVDEPEGNNEDKGKKAASRHKGSADSEMNEVAPETEKEPLPQEDPAMGGEQPQEAPEMPQAQEGEGDDEWSQFDKYQTGGEGTYDLTSEKDFGTVLKVYKLLNNEDDVVVKKDGDKVQLQDNGSGTEYIIDLGGDEEQPQAAEVPQGGEEPMQGEGLNEGFELEYDDDQQPEGDLTDDELKSLDGDWNSEGQEFGGGLDDLDDEEAYRQAGQRKSEGFDDIPAFDSFDDDDDDSNIAGFGDEFDFSDLYENKNKKNAKRNTMKEGKNNKKDVLFEVDLGYTDNYQDKDPIKGLSNNEPSKTGKSWHKGVPTGTEKPWAGETKTKGNPFKETKKVEGSVNEENEELISGDDAIEEATNVGGAVQQRTNSKSHIPANREGHTPEVTRHASVGGDYKEKLEEQLRKIQNENKQLKKGILELRKGLCEAHVTNVNLGKITKLFLENSTSQDEKKQIIDRFVNEAKTVEQSVALYESIKSQLNSTARTSAKAINEQAMKADNSNLINEEKRPAGVSEMLDLIDRMNRY